MSSETKNASSHYIINFYNNIQQLNHTYSQYINLIIEMEFKHGKNMQDMADNEREIVGKTVQTLRHFCNIIYIEFKSIQKNLSMPSDSDIEELYLKIRDEYVIKREVMDKFVINMNSILTKDILQDLLKTSQDYFEEIYSDDKSKSD